MNKNCQVITITTPQKFLLNGLWFGREKPQKAIIFIHGLTATAFSNHKLVVPLAGPNTAVITFSNRGHDKVAKLKKIDRRKKKGYTSHLAGQAHEVFAECVDDLQGAVDLTHNQGVKDIYLAGHSTGCQKSVYYLSKKGKQQLVKGIILLCPVSDYAAIQIFAQPNKLQKAENIARKLVKDGHPHQLLPPNPWSGLNDAQRFLSLYTPDSEEEIFTYSQPHKTPRLLQKIRIPTLAIYAGNDEYHDQPAKKIAQWFKKNSKSKDLTISIIKGAPHNFNGYEDQVVRQVRSWLGKQSSSA